MSVDEVDDALRPVARDLLMMVAASSVIGRMGLYRVPAATRVVIRTARATGAFVAEGQAAPVSELAFGTPTQLVPKKIVSIVRVHPRVESLDERGRSRGHPQRPRGRDRLGGRHRIP